MEKPVISLSACSSYEPEAVYKAVEAACLAAGFPHISGKKVLLKPNILSDVPPERAVTTHPEVLRAVIRFVRKMGGTAYVGDSPTIQRSSFTGKKCGLKAVCDESGAIWVDFTDKPVKVGNASTQKKKRKKNSFTLTNAVNNCDMIISLPKMKTHQLMYMTGAVKNLFGLIPSLAKSPYHLRFPERIKFADMLLDLYQTATPQFSIMDAIIAMEGPGPNSGTPKHMGLIMASSDALALDFTASYVMGYVPELIPTVKQAIKRNLSSVQSIDSIEFPIDHPDKFKDRSYKRIDQDKEAGLLKTALGFLPRRSKPMYNEPKPLFSDKNCIGCGECVEICPANALTLIRGVRVIPDYKKCIRCYCCHEVCQYDAISIEVKGTTV
ncbi:MAG: DUF362 domain-containing protein [Spirochaetia bacterium]|nr:DUF362 domain-containing protein [Spirochaetia bacterium]